MKRVFFTEFTVFAHLNSVWVVLLVFRSVVISVFALSTC